MNQADFNSLCKILQDEKTMYAYEGAFNDAEVQEWLDKQLNKHHIKNVKEVFIASLDINDSLFLQARGQNDMK